MSREWTLKSFKSGNSAALRVPASVGIEPGQEWRLVEDGADFRLQRVDRPKRKFNIDKVWGCAAGLKLIDEDDRWFEERKLNWDEGGTTEA